MPQLAKRLNLHRTTLKRMEDRGVILPGKWIEKPVRGRVYTEEMVKAIEKQVADYFEAQQTGVITVDVAKLKDGRE